jgi:hypothetical protein
MASVIALARSEATKAATSATSSSVGNHVSKVPVRAEDLAGLRRGQRKSPSGWHSPRDAG